MRYHDNSLTLADVPSYTHNILVNPGVTAIDAINPGFSTFEVDESTLIPNNLKLTFVELEKTYGLSAEHVANNDLPTFSMAHSDFGLKDLTA